MPLFNVYLLGHWIDEVLYLRFGGIERTALDVCEYEHHMLTHPDTTTNLEWFDESFLTVVPKELI
jgi:hypothetical protein